MEFLILLGEGVAHLGEPLLRDKGRLCLGEPMSL